MSFHLIKRAAVPALAALLLAGTANIASAESQLSVFGGFQTAPHSKVSVSDQADFTAGWEGKSFSPPPYYGFRAAYWLNDYGYSNLGLSLDYTHTKVYADDATLATSGWSHFEFTDGLNLLTANVLYRFADNERAWTPYVGVGAGINVPHVEVTRGASKTFNYQFGGATLQWQAGIDYKISEHWSVFTEYKGNFSRINATIDNGATLKTNVITNAANVGISFHW